MRNHVIYYNLSDMSGGKPDIGETLVVMSALGRPLVVIPLLYIRFYSTFLFGFTCIFGNVYSR